MSIKQWFCCKGAYIRSSGLKLAENFIHSRIVSFLKSQRNSVVEHHTNLCKVFDMVNKHVCLWANGMTQLNKSYKAKITHTHIHKLTSMPVAHFKRDIKISRLCSNAPRDAVNLMVGGVRPHNASSLCPRHAMHSLHRQTTTVHACMHVQLGCISLHAWTYSQGVPVFADRWQREDSQETVSSPTTKHSWNHATSDAFVSLVNWLARVWNGIATRSASQPSRFPRIHLILQCPTLNRLTIPMEHII